MDRRIFLAICAAALSLPPSVDAQIPDLAGNWEITVKWEPGSTLNDAVRFSLDTSTAKLKTSQDTFTGERKMRKPNGSEETDIWVMIFKDKKVRFVLGAPITSCEGVLKSKDLIEGMCTFGPFTKGPLRAERKAGG